MTLSQSRTQNYTALKQEKKMQTEENSILDNKPIKPGQFRALLICFFLLALDGFDVLAIAFAAPGITNEWGLTKNTLGWVMTMELIGMACGSIFLGKLADTYGRRYILLGSVCLMSAGMLASAYSQNLHTLSGLRILTGIGIGAVLACCNALVAEISNAKYRNLTLIIVTSGYAIGAIIGGLISAELLKYHDWRAIFILGAIGTSLSIVFVFFGLPESVSFLINSAPSNALSRINKSLKKLGHPPLSDFPPSSAKNNTAGLLTLFSNNFFRTTLLLTIAFIANISTFYFILKWTPKIMVDLGFTETEGSYVLVLANLGGVSGVALLALLTRIFDVQKIVVAFLVIGSIFVASIGIVDPKLEYLAFTTLISAFFIQAATSGMYPLMAKYFPTHIRASGTGVVVGLGRGGAIAGPVIAGYLLQADLHLSIVTSLIATGSLAASVAILMLMRKHEALPTSSNT